MVPKSGFFPSIVCEVSFFAFKADYMNITIFFVMTVYLQTSPEVCYERLKRRCREEEKLIPLVRSSFNIYVVTMSIRTIIIPI